MSQALMDFVSARHDIAVAATKLHLAELSLSGETASVLAVNEAEDEMALAARRLTRAIDELPPGRQPKGWAV